MGETALNVCIDGRTERLEIPAGTTFQDVMRVVSRRLQSPGIGITRVRLNGEDITGRSWSSLGQVTAAEIAGLEVETGDMVALAREAIGSLVAFIADLSGELKRTVELYRLGREAEANEAMGRALDGIQVVSHTTVMVERNLGIDTRSLNYKGRPASAKLQSIGPILEDMFAAQKERDWVMLADIIEYELIPHFQDRCQILQMWSVERGAEADG